MEVSPRRIYRALLQQALRSFDPEHAQTLEEVVKRAELRRSERRERKADKAVLPTGPQRNDSGSNGKLPRLHEHGSE
ncbi:hypothetical protein R70199_07606 [Paraburkholderia domus]|nr:hypothetical protein R70199_07606 [Paraburkholderia domus]